MQQLTRRTFLSGFAALPLLGATESAGGTAIRLGGPVFLKSEDPRELAKEHRRLGYSAAYCPRAKATDIVHIRGIREAFAAENVVIAEVGAWKNLLDPDAAKRKENLDYVMERMALAEAVGARCCVDIAGSYNPTVWYGPDPRNLSQEFFDATVENSRKIIDAVKPAKTKFTVEMMGWNIPDGPDSYVKLIKAVGRPAFGVHLDICNGINSPERFYRNTAYIEDCFRKLGPHIISCHAKDLAWDVELNVHFRETIPGRGQMDYKTYLRELAKLKVDAPLMLEHLKTAEEYDEGREFIRKTGTEVGIRFA